MNAPSKVTARKPRDLLSNRLEKVSKDIFKKHYPLITELIGDSPGIYPGQFSISPPGTKEKAQTAPGPSVQRGGGDKEL